MHTHRRYQRGVTTLIIAVMLLGILTVATLFTLNVSFFESRTVGNENRHKIIAQAAEGGLNQAFEIIKANAANLTATDDGSGLGWAGRWQPCTAALASGVFDPCSAEPNAERRATLWRYNAATVGTRLLGQGGQYAPRFNAVGNFADVDYVVGAVLCLDSKVAPGECEIGSSVNTVVTTRPGDLTGLVSVTLVAMGTLADDPAARATVKATIASYREIGSAPNVPIIASGGVNIAGGTADIVPNPNAGGVGVALSIWSASEVDTSSGASGGSGAVKTCHLGEFLGNYQGPRGPSQYQGVTICHDCRCDGLALDKGLISGKYTVGGSGAGRAINYDILHVYPPGAGRTDVLPPNTYFPDASKNLDDPDDDYDDNLFEYMFGIDVINRNGSCVSVDADGKCPDTLYLEQKAEVVDCSTLTAASSGLLWAPGACTLPNGQIGTPLNPVFLVADSTFSYRANTVFYGVFFKRNASGSDDTSSSNSTAQGGGVFYGSVVIDGPIRVRGSPKFVYSESVLQNIVQSSSFTRFGVVPGSWTDNAVLPE